MICQGGSVYARRRDSDDSLKNGSGKQGNHGKLKKVRHDSVSLGFT